jgi:hypothetical protein
MRVLAAGEYHHTLSLYRPYLSSLLYNTERAHGKKGRRKKKLNKKCM